MDKKICLLLSEKNMLLPQFGFSQLPMFHTIHNYICLDMHRCKWTVNILNRMFIWHSDIWILIRCMPAVDINWNVHIAVCHLRYIWTLISWKETVLVGREAVKHSWSWMAKVSVWGPAGRALDKLTTTTKTNPTSQHWCTIITLFHHKSLIMKNMCQLMWSRFTTTPLKLLVIISSHYSIDTGTKRVQTCAELN